MNHFITRVLILFLSLLVLSFGYAQESTPTDSATAMDEVVTKIADSSLFSGSVLVAQNGTILLNKGYGLADREQNIPNTPQTVFRIGSIGKQFTAMGIMILQARGKLDVQDPACNYLTDCPEAWQTITIHHLLTHTSGVVIDSPNLISKPGTKFLYNNDGYRLLGRIIEQVSGKPYDVLMQEMIFDPLKMTHTNFTPHQENEAVGYTTYMISGIPARYPDPADLLAIGGHYSTVEDLYLWDQALYTEQLIPQALLEMMNTPYVSVANDPILQIYGDQTGYGYGLVIGQVNGHRAIGHMGVVEGFHTFMSRYPDDKLVIIVLSNHSDGPVDLITSLVVKKIFGEE
jgi:CubicO group peptidase (beta-lactamase class C family)